MNPSPASYASDAATYVAQVAADHFAHLGLAPPSNSEQDLRDAGLSSLQLVDLIFKLEDRLGVTLPQTLITPANFRSVSAIAATLAAAQLEQPAGVSRR